MFIGGRGHGIGQWVTGPSRTFGTLTAALLYIIYIRVRKAADHFHFCPQMNGSLTPTFLRLWQTSPVPGHPPPILLLLFHFSRSLRILFTTGKTTAVDDTTPPTRKCNDIFKKIKTDRQTDRQTFLLNFHFYWWHNLPHVCWRRITSHTYGHNRQKCSFRFLSLLLIAHTIPHATKIL